MTEHSFPESARDIAEELREYTAMKYAGDCKCGKCQLVPRALVERIYHTLNSTPVEAATPRDLQCVDAVTGQWRLRTAEEIAALQSRALAQPSGTREVLDALADKVSAKITQLEHYKTNDAQLDHAKTIAEGRLSQANQILHWIAEAAIQHTPSISSTESTEPLSRPNGETP